MLLPVALCLLAAIAHGLAFEPFGLTGLAWFALVPLFVALARSRVRDAAALGFLFGLVQSALSAHWLFGIFGPPALLLLCVYGAWHAGAALCLAMVLRRAGPRALVVAAPPIWVAFTFLRAENPWLPFGWFSPGAAVVADRFVLQTASWWGEHGLTALVVAGNAAIATTLLENRLTRRVAVVLVGILLAHVLGATSIADEPAPLRVAVVEGEGEPIEHYEGAIEAILTAHPDARLVVLPEYATSERVHAETDCVVRLGALARRHGVTVLFGGTEDLGEGRFANTVFFVDANGNLVHRQAKSVPVPLFRDGEPARTRTPHAGLGAGICYDMDFPFVTRELVRRGARLVVFPTMDARHWGEVQHRQHAALAPLRAVENRRWLVRCASSGMSLVVDPWGRTTRGSGAFTALVAEREEVTVFTRFGWWLPYACVLVTLLLVGSRGQTRSTRDMVTAS